MTMTAPTTTASTAPGAPAASTAPRSEGSKPIRESKTQRRAQTFLDGLDDLIGAPTPKDA